MPYNRFRQSPIAIIVRGKYAVFIYPDQLGNKSQKLLCGTPERKLLPPAKEEIGNEAGGNSDLIKFFIKIGITITSLVPATAFLLIMAIGYLRKNHPMVYFRLAQVSQFTLSGLFLFILYANNPLNIQTNAKAAMAEAQNYLDEKKPLETEFEVTRKSVSERYLSLCYGPNTSNCVAIENGGRAFKNIPVNNGQTITITGSSSRATNIWHWFVGDGTHLEQAEIKIGKTTVFSTPKTR
jgi:hypothetical protein